MRSMPDALATHDDNSCGRCAADRAQQPMLLCVQRLLSIFTRCASPARTYALARLQWFGVLIKECLRFAVHHNSPCHRGPPRQMRKPSRESE